MRNVYFQGKCVQTGEWVYGCLLQTEHDGTFIVGEAEATNFNGDGTDLYATTFRKVEEKSVGQYTGIKDKNNAEIYRKDIVERNGIKYLVEFELGSFILVRIGDTDMYKEFEDCWNDDVYPLIQLYWNSEGEEHCLPDVEKVGNAFENPELLEQ